MGDFINKFGHYWNDRFTSTSCVPSRGSLFPLVTSTYGATVMLPLATNQEVKKMRSLFTVFVVEEETGDVVLEKTVVATDETQAQQKALLSSGVKLTKDLDEYVTVVDLRGNRNVIEPRTKLQKVKIVKDEAE